jgi:anti-sigma B factor antagonist
MGSEHRLSVRTEARNGIAHICLDGEIDVSTVPVLESHLAPFESDGVGAIMLDLRDLVFTDSTGMHAFLAAKNRVTVTGRRLILVGATPVVRRVFDLTGNQGLLDDGDAAALLGRFCGSDNSMEGQATPADNHE